MIKRFLFPFAIGMLSTADAMSSCDPELYDNFVVKVSSPSGSPVGTAVLITEQGHFLTAKHVMELEAGYEFPPLTYSVSFSGNEEFSARFVTADANLDLALLKVEDFGKEMELMPARFGLDRSGSNLCAVGYPVSSLRSQGRVNRTITQQGPEHIAPVNIIGNYFGYKVIDKKFSAGASGGGVFFEDILVGIMVRGRTDSTDIIGFSYLDEFLKRNGISIFGDLRLRANYDVKSIYETAENANTIALNNRDRLSKIESELNWNARHINDKVLLEIVTILPSQIIEGFFLGEHYPIVGDREMRELAGEFDWPDITVYEKREFITENLFSVYKRKAQAQNLQLQTSSVTHVVFEGVHYIDTARHHVKLLIPLERAE